MNFSITERMMSEKINYLPEERVIVSLTSIKKREDALRETIRCLVRQDCNFPYEVRINLSHEPYLMDDGFDEIPSWITDFKNFNSKCDLQVQFVRNTGPYRKLLPVLQECFDNRLMCIIVTCDDDVQYPEDWLSTLLFHHHKMGGLVAFRGHSIQIQSDGNGLASYANWKKNSDKTNFSLANLPTGKDGVVYRPSYFGRGVLDEEKAMQIAPTADDLWLRWHSLIRGVPCYLINLDRNGLECADSFDPQVSLWEVFNKKGGNDQTAEGLEGYFIKRYGVNVASTLRRYFHYMNNLNGIPSLVSINDPSLYAAKQVRMMLLLGEQSSQECSISARTYELFRLAMGFSDKRSRSMSALVPVRLFGDKEETNSNNISEKASEKYDDEELYSKNLYDSFHKYRIAVAIPTFNRKDYLLRLVQQLDIAAKDFNVYVTIFDDGSQDPITQQMFSPENLRGIEVHRFINHGKKKYWSLVNKIFNRLSDLKADYYFYLADDLEVNSMFFIDSIGTWEAISDNRKISLNLLRDSRVKCWTDFENIEMNFGDYLVLKSQWLDMIMLFDNKLLTYRVNEVPMSRWEGRPLLSSGVGAQLSVRLHEDGYGMYQVCSSLVYHGDHESKMNPEDRKKNPLVSVDYLKGIISDETTVL